MSDPIKANLKQQFEDLEAPGDYCFRQAETGDLWTHITFKCPCGKGEIVSLPIEPTRELGGASGQFWAFNGNPDAPSLTPSIQRADPDCKWHGFLTDGEFREC